MVMKADLLEQELIQTRKELDRVRRLRNIIANDLGKTLAENTELRTEIRNTKQHLQGANSELSDAIKLIDKIEGVLQHTAEFCKKHPDDDVVNCGWKSSMLRIIEIFEKTPYSGLYKG